MSADDSNLEIQTGLSRDLGLSTALSIGVGTMLAAGALALSGLSVGLAGGAAPLAFVLAAVVAALSALSYCEFSALYPQSGEGYLYTHKTFSPPLACFVGLALLLGYAATCALFTASLSSHFHTFFWASPFELLSGGLGLGGLVLLNIKGTRTGGVIPLAVTAALVMGLLVSIWGGLISFGVPAPAELLPTGLSPLGSTAGLLVVCFFGFSSVAAVAEEVVRPEKTIPRAVGLSLLVSLLLCAAVGVLLVALGVGEPAVAPGLITAERLGSPTGLLLVGGLLVVFLVVSNIAIGSGTRVMLAMSRRGHLPRVLGTVDPSTRTPIIAVSVIGGVALTLASLLSMADLALFAGTAMLLAMTTINAALIAHRRRFPEAARPFRVPLVPMLPTLGILANGTLLVQILPSALPVLLVVGLLTLGVVIFSVWKGFQSPEAELPGTQGMIALERSDMARVDFRVLVPIANPATTRPLLELAAAIARQRGGELVVLRVVQIPDQLPLELTIDQLEKEREVLERTNLMVSEMGVPMTSMVKISRNVARAILETARERDCNLVVLGWKGHTSTTRRILGEITDEVVRRAAVDLMLVKMAADPSFKRLLLPTAGGDHARAAEGYAASLIMDSGGSLTVLSIERDDATDGRASNNLRQAGERLAAMGMADQVEQALVKHDSVPQAIVEQSRDYDALVIGATRDSYSRQVLFGSIPEKVAQEAEHSVIVVKAHDPIRAFVGRVVS